MNDLPPDLPRLRTLETWLAHTLNRVRRQIGELERQEQERQQGAQARPPAPDWLLELGIGRDSPPVYVHEGGCWSTGKRARGVSRAAALRALVEGVPACPHCRPDSALGYLDG
ncbi:DUF6233 domain-containing protein [Streptomyces sp. SCL15-4]|uniref:DUF6233 domain-containing protein n=1 Tax=Streptomyces sp. SCL15-4 TaxID=2967221 RepID=UPI002965E808|nr:DUF6233 domain-containing protein [Streptomyces sp. SCL15-4]